MEKISAGEKNKKDAMQNVCGRGDTQPEALGEIALKKEVLEEMIHLALEKRKDAYAPYSHFCVGAALLGKSGRLYTGCNVENAAYGPSNCAERTAFFHAVSEGERSFQAICIAGGMEGAPPQDYCPPCGVCRQVMMEFCHPDEFAIILAKNEKEYKIYTLGQLFPLGFGPAQIKAKD